MMGEIGVSGIGNITGLSNPIVADLEANGQAIGTQGSPAGELHLYDAGIVGPRTYSTGGLSEGLITSYRTDSADGYRRFLDIAAKGFQDGAAGGSVIRFLTNPIDSDDLYNHVSIVPLDIGCAGLLLDKASSNTTQAIGLNYAIDGYIKWGHGIDVLNDDFFLLFDRSINGGSGGDIFRCSPGAKFIMGPGIGSPAALPYTFTLESAAAYLAEHVDGITIQSGNNGIRLDLLEAYKGDLYGRTDYIGGIVGMRGANSLMFATNSIGRIEILGSGNMLIGAVGSIVPQCGLHYYGQELRLQYDGIYVAFYNGANSQRVGYIQATDGEFKLFAELAGAGISLGVGGVKRFEVLSSGTIKALLASVPSYANNAAAISGGLVAGNLYRTGSDPDTVCIVH